MEGKDIDVQVDINNIPNLRAQRPEAPDDTSNGQEATAPSPQAMELKKWDWGWRG